MRPDLHSLAEEDGAGELCRLVDVDVARRPHAWHELVPQVAALHLPLKKIGVRARVLGDRANVGPIAVRDVPKERLALREEAREEVLAEVEHLADAETFEDARLDHVDTGIDRVAEDLAPGRLLQEFGDPP